MDEIFSADEDVQRGKKLAEQLWWSLAKRILKIAGELYGWDENQWRNAQEQFLRPNDYFVQIKMPEG
jgi:hypothetical protein